MPPLEKSLSLQLCAKGHQAQLTSIRNFSGKLVVEVIKSLDVSKGAADNLHM